MTSAAPIKACVFDAFGTLFDVHSPLQSLEPDLGGKTQDFLSLWRTKQLEYTWLRSLMGTYADFAQVTADALDYAMAAFHITSPALRDKLLMTYNNLSLFADAKASVQRVKDAGVRTAILSNGTPAMLTSAVNAAQIGGQFDYIMSVDTVEIFKPSPSVYKLATEALGLEAEQIAFISGNGWDCAGAAQFGFQTVQVNRLGVPEERLGISARIQVKDLLAAADAVLSWR